ncbi:insulin-degrading enzyme, partial [Trifolium medium]|nr:insulin-degrading enzyme [Trifolium medium]
MDEMAQVLPEVIKSPYDIREYRAIKLRNDLITLTVQVPLVPTAAGEPKKVEERKRKCAVAMSVGVGSLHGPKKVQGVAHMI